MMDRNIFEEEHEMFRDAARSFLINEIQPHVDRWAEEEIVDREAFLKAGEQGLLCMWADEKYGGAGVSDFRYEQILLEENARYGDVGFFIFLHSRLVAPYIGALGTDEQKERWLPKCVSGESILAIAMTEPGAGSDLSAIRTKAEDKGDYYLLNGSKTFISNGILGDLVIVAAKTDPNSSHGISLFVVERGMEGFERGKNFKKMGMHSQDTSEMFFNNVKVPKENLLGERGAGPLGVVVSDTFGRPWREGLVDVAIGCAGLAPLTDARGAHDLSGRELQVTVSATADQLAAAAGLLMPKDAGIPAVWITGLSITGTGAVRDTLRLPGEDLFR